MSKFPEMVAGEAFDWIVFDFDGTCYPSSAGVESQLKPLMREGMAHFLGVDESEVPRIRKEIINETGLKETVIGLNMRYGLDPHMLYHYVYTRLDLSHLAPYPGFSDAMQILSSQQKLCLLTNSYQPFIVKALALLGLEECFHYVVTTGMNGFLRKPNPSVFSRLFADHLRVAPSRVAFFDDIPSSLEVLQRDYPSATRVLVDNGLSGGSGYIDLHTGVRWGEYPKCADFATHDVTELVRECAEALHDRGY